MINDTEARTMSRSVLRHRPIAPDRNTQVRTPRASRTRQKPKPYLPDDQVLAPLPTPRVPRRRLRAPRLWVIYVVLGMLATMVLLWLGGIVLNWGTVVSDDIHYGRPRTTNVDHFVGHETNGNTPTHFTALNLSGQIYVIEIPGGHPNDTRLLVGPRLIGSGADLAPVTLSFVGDPHTPDLVIEAGGALMHFHNTGTSYVPV